MIVDTLTVIRSTGNSLWIALQLLLGRAAGEVRLHLSLYFLDALLVALGIALFVQLIRLLVALSIFDRAFGTYYVPGLCTVPLGVTDDIGPGLMAPLRFPLVAWLRKLRAVLNTERRSPSEVV